MCLINRQHALAKEVIEGRTDPITPELGEDRYGLNIAQVMKVFTVEEAHAMRPELRVC